LKKNNNKKKKKKEEQDREEQEREGKLWVLFVKLSGGERKSGGGLFRGEVRRRRRVSESEKRDFGGRGGSFGRGDAVSADARSTRAADLRRMSHVVGVSTRSQ
jgi:hypothetical protein